MVLARRGPQYLCVRSLQPYGLVLVALCLTIAVPYRIVKVSVKMLELGAMRSAFRGHGCIAKQVQDAN
jgi:hypothetical protein